MGTFLAAAAAAGWAAADPAKGKTVFDSNNCATCHNTTSPDKKMGPSLKGIFKRDKLSSGKKVSEAAVRAKIDEGGGGMPGFREMLGNPEKNDLIAYLKTL